VMGGVNEVGGSAEVVGKPRSQGSLLRTLVCLLTCSILQDNNLVDAGSLPS
jgi:hypothetical protein